MGKNNNNAGMHFVRYSNNVRYDNLYYYDKNSEQGIANRRYEAIANLEEMGDYLFTRSVSFVQIALEDNENAYPTFYKVLTYDMEHEETLKHVSTIKNLYNPDRLDAGTIRVREHDRQRIIYITTELYEEKKKLIDKKIVYRFK